MTRGRILQKNLLLLGFIALAAPFTVRAQNSIVPSSEMKAAVGAHAWSLIESRGSADGIVSIPFLEDLLRSYPDFLSKYPDLARDRNHWFSRVQFEIAVVEYLHTDLFPQDLDIRRRYQDLKNGGYIYTDLTTNWISRVFSLTGAELEVLEGAAWQFARRLGEPSQRQELVKYLSAAHSTEDVALYFLVAFDEIAQSMVMNFPGFAHKLQPALEKYRKERAYGASLARTVLTTLKEKLGNDLDQRVIKNALQDQREWLGGQPGGSDWTKRRTGSAAPASEETVTQLIARTMAPQMISHNVLLAMASKIGEVKAEVFFIYSAQRPSGTEFVLTVPPGYGEQGWESLRFGPSGAIGHEGIKAPQAAVALLYSTPPLVMWGTPMPESGQYYIFLTKEGNAVRVALNSANGNFGVGSEVGNYLKGSFGVKTSLFGAFQSVGIEIRRRGERNRNSDITNIASQLISRSTAPIYALLEENFETWLVMRKLLEILPFGQEAESLLFFQEKMLPSLRRQPAIRSLNLRWEDLSALRDLMDADVKRLEDRGLAASLSAFLPFLGHAGSQAFMYDLLNNISRGVPLPYEPTINAFLSPLEERSDPLVQLVRDSVRSGELSPPATKLLGIRTKLLRALP